MIQEIDNETIEAISRHFCHCMGINPDADSPVHEAKNWEVARERVRETFAINKSIREVLQARKDGPEKIQELLSKN